MCEARGMVTGSSVRGVASGKHPRQDRIGAWGKYRMGWME